MTQQNKPLEKKTLSNKKRNHDLQAALRFLENLHTEISIANNLSDIQDPVILKKFREIIQLFKNEMN